jgi:hypothetical protein
MYDYNIDIQLVNVVDQTLAYTAENVANKENTTLDTSTTKYPTNNLVKTYADAKVEDAIVDAVTNKAPSQNAVFDALAGKQATLNSGTNIKTVNGSSLLGSGDLVATQYDSDIEAMRAFNSSLIAQTVSVPAQTANTSTTLTSGTALYGAVYLPKATTCTGVTFFLKTAGLFTANNENSLALYSVEKTTGDITRVAISANLGSNWTGTANAYKQVNWTASVSLPAGVYMVGALFNYSAITTLPAIASGAALANSAMGNVLMTPNAKLYCTQSLTAQGSAHAAGFLTATTITPWFGLY